MDEVIEEIRNEEAESSNQESVVSANTDEGAVETAATEKDNNNADVVSEVESKARSTNGNAKQSYSDIEKATYSFHKQLNKQKSKYEKAMAEKEAQFNQLLERLDRLENPDKYRAKTRNDFSTDDEYIDHIVSERVNNILKGQMEAYQKEQAQRDEMAQVEATHRSRQDDNVARLFPDEAARSDYQAKVNDALSKGLGELIDSDTELANYIIMSPMGPKLMYKLATDVEAVKSLFENTTAMDRQFKIREIEHSLSAPTVVNNNSRTAPIGRPGKNSSSPSKDLFESNDSILNFLSTR